MNPRVAVALVLAFAGALALGYGAGGAVRAVAIKPTPSTTSDQPLSIPSSKGGPDLTALAEKCGMIPIGTVAPYLQPDALIHGTEADPRTGQNLPVIRTIFDTVIPADRPPFSITGAVQEPGRPAGGGDQPIDRMGSLQFWMYWDGTTLDKGVRRWNGKAWIMAINDDAKTLTAELKHNSVAFHSGDIHTGATVAFITADADGCAALGLDSQGRPASGF